MIWRIAVIGGIVLIVVLFLFGLGRNPREIPSPLVDKAAPVFSGQQLDGKTVGSEDLKGKVALVSFWATWCTTCKADEPLIDAIKAEFGADPDFVIIGVATQDTEEKVARYLKTGRRDYVNLFDAKGRLAIDFGVYGVPETYLIDRQGKVVDKIAGPINRTALAEKIRVALAAKGKEG